MSLRHLSKKPFKKLKIEKNKLRAASAEKLTAVKPPEEKAKKDFLYTIAENNPMVITVTMNPCIDTSSSVESVVPEHKLRCRMPIHEPGGGGINVSRAIKNLGGVSRALYPSGGQNGKILEILLSNEGIDHSPVGIDAMTRENLTIFEESSTQQYRFTMPGAKMSSNEGEAVLKFLKQMSSKPDYLVASGSLAPGLPDNFYAQICKLGKSMGISVMVDTSERPLYYAVEEGCFLIKPNMREMNLFAKNPIKDEGDLEKTALEIIKNGKCEVVVVSLGAAGVMLATKQGCKRVRAPTVPIKSKVGAGDSMVAGICIGLSEGKDIYDAVLLGVAAGSAAVMTPGTELCRRTDTEKLYKSLKKKLKATDDKNG